MPASQTFISDSTPLGVQLIDGGATFKTWAPGALAVHVVLYDPGSTSDWVPTDENRLLRRGDYWTGFFPGVVDGTLYRFWIEGPGGADYKRDPRARELELFGYPEVDCIARGANDYPWHDGGFRPPAFHELIIYQFHVGVFYASDGPADARFGKFLDVIDRIEYLAELGINAVQPLPIQDWGEKDKAHLQYSRGYNNTDFFSPEMDYCVAPNRIGPYLNRVNELLAKKGQPELQAKDLFSQSNQLKAMIDLFHLYGIAVILDVVYNHAGGPMDEESMRFFDQPASQNWWDSDQYFIGGPGWAGGRIFDYTKPEVRAFITDNTRYFLDEFHVDGFRYDEVRVITNNGGRTFCRELTDTLRFHKPTAIQIAEYWDWDRASAVLPVPDGLGFDAALDDGLRYAIRDVIQSASGGKTAPIHLDTLRNKLKKPVAFPATWQSVVHIENHDLVDADRPIEQQHEILPRIPKLADPSNAHSWYARSRARVATGLVLTAPGIPMLFMGQEFLEDKPWHNDPKRNEFFIYWDGLQQPGPMRDFLKFVRELCWLRRRYPALQGEGLNPYFNHNQDRVLAFQRWVEGIGQDVIVVVSLAEDTRWNYPLPLPVGGFWHEVFNSDAYDSLPSGTAYNPNAVGNPGGIIANGPARAGQPTSARITLPANSLLVFAKTKNE
ncbi:alpha amylase C-terminal domain-containing protein [Larkinella sp. VNQ87]|uniref:alpha-amylase family glycosyl hydrolase n=1 Tax=Larkinella sp. VNQ87 TaxID=3400921 RepID=UPI003C0B3204